MGGRSAVSLCPPDAQIKIFSKTTIANTFLHVGNFFWPPLFVFIGGNVSTFKLIFFNATFEVKI